MTDLVSISVPTPDIQQDAVTKFVAQAQSLTVTTQPEYETASAILSDIKARAKVIESQRVALKKPIDEAARAIQAFFKDPLEALSGAESVIKGKLVSFIDEQRRREREAQAKLDEAARKERQKLEERAAKAEATGKAEKAEALQEQAAAVVAQIVSIPVKAEGVSSQTVWSFEVTDPSLVPDQYKLIDEVKIRGVVRALKSDAKIPGVRVFEKTVISARSA